MKRILLLLCACMMSLAGRSQTLTLDNLTNCPVLFRALASDFPGASTCNLHYSTNDILIPPGGSMALTIADLITPPAGPFSWTYVRFRDPAYASCPSGPSAGPCWYGVRDVADPACGMAPTTSCMVGAMCGPCAGVVTVADWHPLSPVDAHIIFHP